jgi:uncharacterized protein YutD
MFYFASDNPLAISVVSQLKALKAAGFHPEANVVAHFDPFTEGTPTHIFDVNLINKLKNGEESHIGFCEDEPVVRNMIEDKLWRDERTRPPETASVGAEGELVRTALHRVLDQKHHVDYRPPIAPFSLSGLQTNGGRDFFQEPDPETSLSEFLRFCADNYPAQHYMLFILGHGVVVGNDVFMRDEHTTSKDALTLTELGRILTDFKNYIGLENHKFELVSFQSCSVSSLEVAFELQDTANYMLASQGPTFVGSWPYRQILIRIFNELGRDRINRNINVRDLLLNIYNYCLFNSADFLLAGYSFQLTLCNLTKISRLKEPIENLSQALLDGLLDLTSTDYILLSHWKAQSFFNEMYTDLYDFCFCFNNKVKELRESRGRVTPQLRAIEAACNLVMDTLVKENPKREGDPVIEQFIVAADSLGPAYQYSRGFSVYFPWSEPSRDSRIMAEYERYRFSTDFENASWLMFLREYFSTTMRDVSSTEPDPRRFLPLLSVTQSQDQRLDEDLASLVYSGEGLLNQGDVLALKSDPTDKMGGEQESPSIKNYPRDVRPRRARGRQARQSFPLTESFRVLNRNGQNGNGNHS